MPAHDPYAALRHRDYRLFAGGAVLANVGFAMQGVAVGWELYERTNSALPLGVVGLVQVAPVLAFALPAGHLADRLNRRRILIVTQLGLVLASLALAWCSWRGAPVNWYYACLFAGATARAFGGPAYAAMLPQLVPADALANAVTWRSSGFQFASVIGPALGGALIAATSSAMPVYLVDAALRVTFWGCVLALAHRPADRPAEPVTLRSLVAGFRFVWNTKVIFAAVSLDMFAVLFGGATALLPIYAKDILHVGPTGLGWLRAAPAVGALLMAITIAHRPAPQRAGAALLWAVAGFGVATIVFGVSRSFALSLAMLFLTGALDNISVVVRHTLVQVMTPDAMRGRVSAVNSIFITSSNELGAFESGLVAAWFGAIVSVVSGGVGTLVVVALTAWLSPSLRRLGGLHQK
jgi:MFS family permease